MRGHCDCTGGSSHVLEMPFFLGTYMDDTIL